MRVGEEAFGRYRIEAVLGRHRSVHTYAATSLSQGEPVLLTTAGRARADDAQRVARAIETLIPVRVARITRVLAAGSEATTAWAASARLEGLTLRAHLAVQKRIEPASAVEMIIALLASLDGLHGAGHAHLSIRPETIVFPRTAGLDATLTDLEGARLTAGAPLLVPTLAPEQLDNTREPGPRADVFAICALLYELVSGAPAFAGASSVLAPSIATDTRAPLSTRRAGISDALDAAIARGLAKDPSQRFATAGELAVALAGHRQARRAAPVRMNDVPSATTPRGGVPIGERPPDDEVAWSAGAIEGSTGKSTHARQRATGAAPRYSGALASQHIAYARRAYGSAAVERALAQLDEADREEVSGAAPAGWIRIDAFERFHEALAQALDRSVEETHPEIAKNGGKSTFQSLWRVLLRIGGASFIMSRAPVVYSKTYDTGAIESRDIGPSGGSFVLVGWPDVPEFVLRGLRAGMTSALEAVGRTGVEMTSHRNADGATFKARWDA